MQGVPQRGPRLGLPIPKGLPSFLSFSRPESTGLQTSCGLGSSGFPHFLPHNEETPGSVYAWKELKVCGCMGSESLALPAGHWLS